MNSLKLKGLTLGIVLVFLAFAGCSSNPASSTLTCDNEVDTNCAYAESTADNSAGATCASNGTSCGYDCAPSCEPPAKFDEADNNDIQELPVYPN